MYSPAAIDPELNSVVAEILRLDPDGSRSAQVLRDTLDQLYDGQRTGRYRWDQLHKTEKTHCGTLVEINLHREFNFEDGHALDYCIAGFEVDCKYSQKIGAWMIPPEATNHLCLLISAVDNSKPTWSMGIVRASENRLHTGGNRDRKVTLNEDGRNAITWIFKDSALPPNVLLQLERTIVDKILSQKSGQKCVNELFRNTLGLKVGRAAVETAGQQEDPMKRVRMNGGARGKLKSEGILILGQYQSHCTIAEALGVPVPSSGEFVPVKVTPTKGPGNGVAKIDGRFWKIAGPHDPIVSAPILPKV